MISWHPRPFTGDAKAYADGWRTVDTMDVERLAKCLTRYVWSGIAWRGGVRRHANFHASYWCVYDFETPHFPLKKALKVFADCVHVIGTTKSHGTDKLGIGRPIDCFRVAVPWEHPVTDLRTHHYNMGRLVEGYPLDTACKDGARLYYPCREVVSVNADGYVQEVKEAPPPRPPPYLPPGVIPVWANIMLEQGMPVGRRNILTFRVAKDLIRSGATPGEALERIRRSHGDAPLPDNELTATIAGAMRAVKVEAQNNQEEIT